MENPSRQQAIQVLTAHLDADGLDELLNKLYDAATARGLDHVSNFAYEPIADYYVDGINQAADPEGIRLNEIVAAACYDLNLAIHAHDTHPDKTPTI